MVRQRLQFPKAVQKVTHSLLLALLAQQRMSLWILGRYRAYLATTTGTRLSNLITYRWLPSVGINIIPVFSDDTTTTRSVAENTARGANIGAPVSATNSDNDTLTYTLSGTDAASFDIDGNYRTTQNEKQLLTMKQRVST